MGMEQGAEAELFNKLLLEATDLDNQTNPEIFMRKLIPLAVQVCSRGLNLQGRLKQEEIRAQMALALAEDRRVSQEKTVNMAAALAEEQRANQLLEQREHARLQVEIMKLRATFNKRGLFETAQAALFAKYGIPQNYSRLQSWQALLGKSSDETLRELRRALASIQGWKNIPAELAAHIVRLYSVLSAPMHDSDVLRDLGNNEVETVLDPHSTTEGQAMVAIAHAIGIKLTFMGLSEFKKRVAQARPIRQLGGSTAVAQAQGRDDVATVDMAENDDLEPVGVKASKSPKKLKTAAKAGKDEDTEDSFAPVSDEGRPGKKRQRQKVRVQPDEDTETSSEPVDEMAASINKPKKKKAKHAREAAEAAPEPIREEGAQVKHNKPHKGKESAAAELVADERGKKKKKK